MGIKAIFFDIDGTLVDSNDQHVRAWDAAFRSAGVNFDRATIHAQIGKGADMLLPTLLPNSDAALRDRLTKAHGDVYKRDYLPNVRPFPGARELLVRAHEAGQQLVLATSASQPELDHYLDLLNARDLVHETTSADDVAHTKPAPDIFAAALTKVAPLNANEVMVVGDTPYDMEAARKCGIQPIGVRSGKFPDDALNGAGAAALYDDVAALLAAYDQSPLACL